MARRIVTAIPTAWRRPPLMLIAIVLLAHALLLASSARRGAPREPPPPARPSPVVVRSVQLPAPATPREVAQTAPPSAAAPVTAPAQRARPRATTQPASRTPSKPRAPIVAVAASPSQTVATSEEAVSPTNAEPASENAAVTAAPTSPGPSAPVHLPPSATLDYAVTGTARGIPFEADAQLIWQRNAAHYQAEWVVRLPLVGERSQRSEGVVTDAGLAPERYAERARSERAAHFDPAGGRIRFSANTPDAPLQPSAQDRLSVSLQLAGLIAAAPARYPPGATITLQTAGVRDAEPWHWQVLDDEVLQVNGQDLTTTRLLRQPRKDYDTRVELWLARAHGHLPVRLRITQTNGDVADQQLKKLPEAR